MTKLQRISLGILLFLQLVIGLLGAGSRMLWLGHEPDYFSVVRFLEENGHLPARSDFEGAARGADIAQATQAPLFSYIALPLVALFDDGAAVPPGIDPSVICEGASPSAYPYMLTTAYNLPLGGTPAAAYSLRIMNLVFALGMAIGVYFTTRTISAGNHATALVAAALAGFLPQVFDLSIFISGESLLLLISSINLFFAVRLVCRSTIRPVDLVGLIITALLGPLTKSNGYVLVAGTAIVLVFLVIRQIIIKPHSHATRLLLISVGVLLLGIVGISVFNYAQYGSIVGRYQNMLAISIERMRDFNALNLITTLRDTSFDYTSAFPIQRQKLLWLYILGGLSGLIAFAGGTAWLVTRRDRSRLIANLLLLVYALAAVVLVLMRGNLVNDLIPDQTHTPVRYYLSGLPAFAVISALGWQSLSRIVLPVSITSRISTRLARLAAKLSAWNWLGFLWALVWVTVVIWNVAQDIAAYPTRQVLSDADFAALVADNTLALVPDDPSLPADVPHLRAFEYTVDDDGILHLTAYMVVQETPTLNYVARIALGDGSGLTSTCELIPQRGRYPVTRWEPDQIVAVQMEIPNCSAEGSGDLNGPLDLTLDWLPADASGQFVAQNTELGQSIVVNADLPRARTCLSSLGVFDDTFQVVQYNGPGSIVAGDHYLPSVNWYVRDEIRNGDLLRVYTLTHDESGQTYTCEGPPRMGEYPIAQWHRGEVIYFDQCVLLIPPDAPSGAYTLSVGLRDSATDEYLPITSSQDDPVSPGWLNVASITVQPRD